MKNISLLKKALLLLFLIITSFLSFGQIDTTYPSRPQRGNINQMDTAVGMITSGTGLGNKVYTDTTQANTNKYIRSYTGAQIYTLTPPAIWVRTAIPRRWVQVGTGSSVSVTSYNKNTGGDSSILVLSDGTRYAAFDRTGASVTVSTYGKNLTRDSTILTLSDGTRYAAKDSAGGGAVNPDTTITKFPVYTKQTVGQKDSLGVYGVDSSFQNFTVRGDSLIAYRFNGDSISYAFNALGYIPLSGTEVGKPVTGSIETRDNVVNIGQNVSEDIGVTDGLYSYQRYVGDGSLVVLSGNKNNSTLTSLTTGQESIVINSDVVGSVGLSGAQDFTPNITDLDYVQETYVIPRGGTKEGKPITGSLEVTGNKFSIYKSDADNNIKTDVLFNTSDIDILAKNFNEDSTSELVVGVGRITIGSNIPSFKGISGDQDYTVNLTTADSLFYVQKKYVTRVSDSIQAKQVADSIALSSAIALKQNLVTLTTTGTSGASTFNQSTGALNIPNYAVGVTSTKAYTPLIVRNDSIYQRYNVKAYGATGDSTQDATPFVQAAVNACILNGGGSVYFPKGFYWFNSALVTSAGGVNPNSQIYIPPVSYDNNTRTHIAFEGEVEPNYTPSLLYRDSTYPKTGVIIKSTITGSGTLPSVFGGIGTVGNNFFTFHYVSFKNITLLVKANAGGTGPTMTGINGGRFASLEIDNCVVGIDTSLYRDTIPQNDVAGIITTFGTGETFSRVSNSLAYGFRYGIVAGEHCYLDNAQAQSCYASFVMNGHPSGGHPVYASTINSHWSVIDVLVPNTATDILKIGAGSNFFVNLLKVEPYNTNARWFNNTATIVDTGNRGKAVVNYSIINSPGSTGNMNFVQYNGTAVFSSLYYQRPLKVNSANVVTSLGNVLGISNGVGSGNFSLALNSGGSTTTSVAYQTAGNNMFYTTLKSTGDFAFFNSDANLNKEVFTMTQAGVANFNSVSGSTVANFKNNSGSGNMVVNFSSGTNTNTNIVFQNNTANVWYFGNTGAAGVNNFRLFNSDANGNSQRFSLTQAGILTLNAYGAGTATFDASGNISSSSDIRLKTDVKPSTTGLKAIMNIKPITYKWNGLSGNETKETYMGFSAQNVKENIPYSTGVTDKGYLTLQDRAIIATLVLAIQELKKEIDELKNKQH